MPTPTEQDRCPTRGEFGQDRPSTPLHVSATSDDGRHLSISAHGEIDADSAHLLRSPLVGHAYDSVDVDCRGVEFMGLAGIDELLSIAVRYRLRVVPSRAVQRVVDLCGVADLLSLVPPPATASDLRRSAVWDPLRVDRPGLAS